MSDLLKLKPEEYLIREGEESNEMFFLKSGTLGVFKTKGNVERQIGTIMAGELVGEMSFLDGQPRSASVKAINEAIITVIPQETLDKIQGSLPPWYKALVNTLLDRLRRANARIKV